MACPSAQMLSRYVNGLAAPEEAAWVADHALSCERCAAILAPAWPEYHDRPASTATVSLYADDTPHSGERDRDIATTGSSDPAPIADEPSFVGPYRVEGVLGSGGMGVVYRATDPRSMRWVAVKTVVAQRRTLLAGLRDEILFLKEIRHPGIVEILDWDVACEVPWYAMELIEGATIATLNRELWGALGERTARARLPGGPAGAWASVPSRQSESPTAAGGRLADVLRLYAEVAVALGYVHRAGIVHCDLKPANVFLRPDGRPLLADFGLLSKARGAVGRETLTPALRVRGTLPYISPEVIEAHIPDARADLYSLGCMLYETVVGAPPFWSPVQSQLLRMHVEARPEPPSGRVAGVDVALDSLILGLLAKQPGDRINDAYEVADTLRDLGGQRTSQPPSGPRPRRSAYLFRPHLTGRDEDVAVALDCCRRVWQGHGALITVEGESGIGKTFFANEVAQRAVTSGLQVFAGEATSISPVDGADAPAEPLQLFSPLLRAIADRCREHGPQETARILGPNVKLLAEFEPSLARLPGAEGGAAPSSLPPGAARDRYVRALSDTIARLAEAQPFLLTLDDVQWADDLSMAVIEALTEDFLRSNAVVVLAAFRSEEASPKLRELSERPWAQRIQLRRLNAREVGSVVSDMLATAGMLSPVADYVHLHSEGVPFFVAEYLRAMTEEGVLERSAGRWRIAGGAAELATALHALPVPGVLRDVVRRRLSMLPEDCRSALEAGAVLGRRFHLDELSETMGVSAADLSGILPPALDHRLLDRDHDRRYRFPHDKIREALYGELPPSRRRELHASAGAALCNILTEESGLEERFGTIGHHFREAEQMDRAVPFLARAGAHALRLSASADAAAYLREALALEQTLSERVNPVTRATWCRMLAQALQGIGRVKESIEPLTDALALLGQRVPTGGWRFGQSLIREVVAQLTRRVAVAEHGERRALETHRLELGRTLDALTQAYFYAGQNLGFMLAALKTMNVLEDGPASSELALAYAHVAATASFVAPSFAPHYFQLAHATLDRLENPSTASHVEMLHGLTSIMAGKRVEADHHLERSLALAARASHFRRWDECAAVRASSLITTGPLSRATTLLGELEASARRRGDDQITAWALLIQGQQALRTGRPEVAEEIQGRVDLFATRLAPADQTWVVAQGAYVAHLCGQATLARQRVEAAAKLIANTPPPQPHLAMPVAMFAETRIAMAVVAGGSAELREATRACDTLWATARIHPMAKPLAWLQRGVLLQHTRRHRAARRAWLRGRNLARSLGYSFEEARLEAALASAAPCAADAAPHLARVDELVRHLDVPLSTIIRPSNRDRR